MALMQYFGEAPYDQRTKWWSGFEAVPSQPEAPSFRVPLLPTFPCTDSLRDPLSPWRCQAPIMVLSES